MSKWIAEPGQELVRPRKLFELGGPRPYSIQVHPRIETDLAAYEAVCRIEAPYKGIDLEFPKIDRPTIVSVTLPERIVSIPWGPQVRDITGEAFTRRDTQWVAHSGISADKPVIDVACGLDTPLDIWEDSIISHFTVNQHLTKSPAKSEDGDDGGALGLMNLWAMASLVTDLFHWKTCRGAHCYGPCPKHDPIGYCGVDSWAGLIGFLAHKKEMEIFQIPFERYRERVELTQDCYEMEQRGVAVDVEYVWKAGLTAEAEKISLFPENQPFNPRSSQQVLKWFKENSSLQLKKNDKKVVRDLLLRIVNGYGYETVAEFESSDDLGDAPADIQTLFRLDKYKEAGKGFDPWFGEKYIQYYSRETGEEVPGSLFEQEMQTGVTGKYFGLAHPRFITVGASTTRLSSARPNFMNIPGLGFGAKIRTAIIPRNPKTHDLLKADYKQLELRMCLFLAGVDASIIGKDAFTWLVQQTGDSLHETARGMGATPENVDKLARNLAKRIAHAGDYLEGFKLYSYEDLRKSRIADDIHAGALVVYTRDRIPWLDRDWTFHGKVVGFTGVNLALALFRKDDRAARKRALDIQEGIYFQKFQRLREWQMKALYDIEKNGYVRFPTGNILKLYEAPEKQAKTGIAALGQGTSALYVQAIMRRYAREKKVIPYIQVHDELVFEFERSRNDDDARDFLSLMAEETAVLPGFSAPIDSARGDNWKEMRSL